MFLLFLLKNTGILSIIRRQGRRIGVFTELKAVNYFRHIKFAERTATWAHKQEISKNLLYVDSVKIKHKRKYGSKLSERAAI